MPSTQTDRLYGMTTSVAVKPPCRVQTTAAITLSGEQTVNGVAVVTGDRVLVKDQADNTTNGIYIADTSAWSRAPDFDGSLDAVDGTLVLVHATSGPDQIYELSATNPVIIGTSALTFSLSSLTTSAFGATLIAAANAAAARTLLAAVGGAEIQAQTYTAFTTGGTNTAYTLTPDPAITAYAAGQSYWVTFALASGAAPTLAISGIATPPNLVKQAADGTYSNIAANDIPANHRGRVTLLNATQAVVELPSSFGATGAISGITSINGGQIAGNRRFNMNGDFAINQELPATNADDTYAHDGWYALTQTGTIAVSTLSDVEDGLTKMARLTQSQAVAQRMGYAQIIEGKRCKKHRGQQVTFKVGRTRLSSSANVRYAVLEWTGTEDAVTSDVVNDWTSSSYTAGGFFNSTTLTVSGVSQQALTANTLTDGSELTVTLGSTFNNIILFEWTESTVAQNVTLDLGLAQIEPSAVATEYEYRDDEMTEVLRHYCKTFDDATAPATGAGGGIQITSTGSGNKDCFTWFFPVPMRGTPDVITTYNPTSANANWRDTTGAADRTAAVDLSSAKMVAVTSNPGTNGNLLRIHISASKRL